MGAQRAGAPLMTGSVPPLAPFYHVRHETGFGLADGLRPGKTILLVPAVLGTGGTGKTQLALGFAHTMSVSAGNGPLRVPAGSRSAIIAGFTRAAADLGTARGEGGPRTAPQSASSAGCAGPSAAGRSSSTAWSPLSTSTGCGRRAGRAGRRGQPRLRESELAAAGATNRPPTRSGFSRREALGYLNARLTGYPDQRIEALDLAEDLGGLPIMLPRGRRCITVNNRTCREYGRSTQRLASLAGHRRLPRRCSPPRRSRLSTSPLPHGRAVLGGPCFRRGPRHQRDPGGCPDLAHRVRQLHRGRTEHRLHGGGKYGGEEEPSTAASRASCGPPTPTWSSCAPGQRGTTAIPCAPSGCTRRCRPRCAPTCAAPANVEQVVTAAATALAEASPARRAHREQPAAKRGLAGLRRRAAAPSPRRPVLEAGRAPGAYPGRCFAQRAPGARPTPPSSTGRLSAR